MLLHVAWNAALLALSLAAPSAADSQPDSTHLIRVNQVGYLPDGPKVAVVCSLTPGRLGTFEVVDASGRRTSASASWSRRPSTGCSAPIPGG